MILLLINVEFMIHEIGCDKCDVWLSCCVLVVFGKMGQKRRSMILNGFMELLWWI